MRIYKIDGTFEENPNDTDFGWYFHNTSVEENYCNRKKVSEQNIPSSQSKKSLEESFMESIDLESIKPIIPKLVQRIDPNIPSQPVENVIECKLDIEGPHVKKTEHKLLRELKNVNCKMPSKEELAKLISPCNVETKMLMSIVYFAKSKSMLKEEASEELFKAVNLKTTNFKHLINGKETIINEEMHKEIQNYHATKEDNMLSLMMELILTDINCNLEDIVDVNQPDNGSNIPQFVFETSDLGNSIQTSYSSKDENLDKTNYMEVPNTSSILSSIGLSDEYTSILSFSEETSGMHSQLAEIKESFHEEENRVDQLIKMALDLEKNLKETLYLDDILHLLKGEIDKVISIKFPFRVFYEGKDNSELNLII